MGGVIQPPVGGSPSTSATLTLTPLFKMVFLSVLFLTLLCLGLALYLSLHQETAAIKNLNDKVLTVFNLGCGAIIGLLGGKTLN